MTRKRFIDFDAFWDEQSRKPLTIKVFGVPHLLAASIPAKVVQRITVLKMQVGDDLDLEARPELIFELANDLFGKQRVADWVADDRMDMDKIGDLFMQTMKAYSAKSDEEDGEDEGEAETPETGSSQTSSSPGA